MDFQLFQAKNGSLTCSFDGFLFHSSYNPEKESETFIANLNFDFKPKCIIAIEPGLSYCEKYLRKRFPGAKLIAVRLCGDFFKWDCLWDKVFYYDGAENFCETLYTFLGEELLFSSQFFSWGANKKIFPESEKSLWNDILDAVKKSRDVLFTRSFFSQRWLFNTVSFLLKTKKTAVLNAKTEKDILICASGPSLRSSLKFIKKFEQNFFIIALSSAVSVLRKNGIKPDLTLSTDGGFWAKYHLKKTESPLALSMEGTAFAYTFNSNQILPLVFENSAGEYIAKKLKLPFCYAQRNGTVSGTAAKFALNLTEKNVYFAGLDLAFGQGFQHTQPNELENLSAAADFRLNTKETRITKSRFNSESTLRLYRDWFTAQNENFSSRVFRISDRYEFSKTLSPIRDIFWDDLKFSEKEKIQRNENIFSGREFVLQKEDLLNAVLSLFEEDFFEKELFPIEKILLERAADSDSAEKIKASVRQKKDAVMQKIRTLL